MSDTKKYMRRMLIILGILFGLIFAYKLFGHIMMGRYFAQMANQGVTVSATKVEYSEWQPMLKSVGSLQAITGVNVTTQLAGMVESIHFTSGGLVTENTLLIQLSADAEIGQLKSLRAQAELAKVTYERDQAQYKVHAISKQQLDSDRYNLENLQGQVQAQVATVDKKTIRAPFTGRLGIRQVNIGQYLNAGDTIVTLQTLDPIFVNFYLPQQALSQVKLDQIVRVTTDVFTNKVFGGRITTIQPIVDVNSRNVEIQATILNPDYELTPGMYASVEIEIGQKQNYLTLPQTAISFNPYGNIVYVVNESGKDKKGKPILTVMQQFVTTGDTRGDQIAVLSGLKEGQMVVTSGQLKLKNGTRVEINNTIVPSNNPDPKVSNEHTEQFTSKALSFLNHKLSEQAPIDGEIVIARTAPDASVMTRSPKATAWQSLDNSEVA